MYAAEPIYDCTRWTNLALPFGPHLGGKRLKITKQAKQSKAKNKKSNLESYSEITIQSKECENQLRSTKQTIALSFMHSLLIFSTKDS